MTEDDLLNDLRSANRAFYDALDRLDPDAMSAAWMHTEDVVCIHPGWDVTRGWPAVRATWSAIFVNTDFMKFNVSGETAVLDGTVGRVHCRENIYSLVDGRQLHSQVAATNLFVRRGGLWKMVLHHGSPIAGKTSIGQAADPTSH
jgi:ketosteroid isomerase-like protein